MTTKPTSFFVESWEDSVEDTEFYNPLEIDIRFKHLTKKVYNQAKITENKLAEIRKYFNRYDSKKYGFINSKYVVDIFRLSGQNPDAKLCEKLLAKANQSNTGMIIFSDMVSLFGKYWKTSDQIRKEIREALKVFDTNGTEILNIDNLAYDLQHCGEKLDAEEIEAIQKYLRTSNKDGKILISDFMKIVDADDKKGKTKKKGKDKSIAKQMSLNENRQISGSFDEEAVSEEKTKPKLIKKSKSSKLLKK